MFIMVHLNCTACVLFEEFLNGRINLCTILERLIFFVISCYLVGYFFNIFSFKNIVLEISFLGKKQLKTGHRKIFAMKLNAKLTVRCQWPFSFVSFSLLRKWWGF